ncbi:hypothetical protein [Niallia nealsonii]|uniref:Uncharacterized protein n=1 Tax=Niallia nealsonii TaxID=115979 RepID=A0A2N0Z340_9BACI|nr:hypothetical protein [Niallia nealsonii]PKG23928.1 hypothetical protein CWS01_09145 [Niallia nealsonii]
MKQAIYLLNTQKQMVITAMEFHRSTLQGMNKKLFDIAFNKVNRMDEVLELDGMEMIYLTQSMNRYAKYLSKLGEIYESKLYRAAAEGIEIIRIKFQMENGPKVKKEKAASAGTLTA